MNFLSVLKHHDWPLNIAIVILAAISLTIIGSTSSHLLLSQAVWFTLGFTLIFIFAYLDFRPLMNYKWFLFGFYFFSIALLLGTLLFSPLIRKTHSWIVLGPLQFQPSELAKLALIILFSYFFARRHIGIAHVTNILVSFFYVALPAMLIFLQPDWGSALIFVGLWIGFLLISGMRWRHVVIGFILFSILAGASWVFFLQDYQKERIIGFLEPTYDPLGINYSVIQSKIAIGSAGFLGKGFHQGTQTQLGFLTEPATDFVFAAFVEEWGLLGGMFLLGTFLFLLIRIVIIGIRARDSHAQFLCLGVVILFLLEFIFNIGSNLGLMPVVGITFPLVSSGGSSLLTKLVLLGIVQGVAVKSSF